MGRLLQDMAISRGPLLSLMIVGLFWGSFAGLMPDIKARAGAGDGQMGAALMLPALGGMTAMYLAPNYVQWLRPWGLPVAGVVLLAVFHAPIFATDLGRLAFMALLMGASVALFDIAANIRITNLEEQHGRGLMNLNHAMFSFGFAAAAYATALARKAGYGPVEVLPVMAAVAGLFLLASLERPQKVLAADADAELPETGGLGQGAPRAVTLWTALVLFGAFVGENATEAWSALHIERTLGAEAGHGSYGPAMLGLVMGFGRLAGQFGADRVGEVRLVLVSACLGVIGALIIAAAWSPAVVLVGVAIVALGMAVIVPSANSVLGRRVPRAMRGLALSRAWMFGMGGFFFGPAMIGGLAELGGLRFAYVGVACVVALIVPAILALGRYPKV